MDFKSSYNRFTREVKERFIYFKKNISKDVAEWKGKFAPTVQADDKLQKLIGTIEICNEINNRIESKFLAFERRIIELENEKHQMKVDIKNLQHEKCQLLNKLSNFDEIEQSNKKLENNLDREISEKTGLKLIVQERLQDISRLEKRLKNEKNSHSVIQSTKISLEKKIERLQMQHSESKKADEINTANWKIRLKESETKLQNERYKNTQLTEKHLLLEEYKRKNSGEVEELRTLLQDNKSALEQEKRKNNQAKTQLKALIKRNHELEEKNKTTENQLELCASNNAELNNTNELLDNRCRSLKNELTTKEQEKLCLIDKNNCSTDEIMGLKNSIEALEKKLKNHNETKMENHRLITLIGQFQVELNTLEKEKTDLIVAAKKKEMEDWKNNDMETKKNNEPKKSNLNSRQESFIKIRW
ncbi:uncharacterized protein Y116A8C.11-like [Toxorhynchites rutilus septentrionalis]|uniref:uncharacterized protein Y116A8C.11-like n=1 Tax=Toxorhynchites rutilus septentrionalis TaxID=329112 RepID=UPI00247AB794|nr:uncharacterized protein Y116A8C.11-like [Toxorhynchites rutilus septentrionalis]XP_055620329.1 uncharacterized protein Y116A8C.11-like [Toxorhynchites rutilus septentrionalis]XP_055620330.1 uncharacterized protein Y116A8C.11-like [Toxorhynchites rutilus septentrionalis]